MPDSEVGAGVLHEQNIFCLYCFGTYSLVGRDKENNKIHRKLINKNQDNTKHKMYYEEN